MGTTRKPRNCIHNEPGKPSEMRHEQPSLFATLPEDRPGDHGGDPGPGPAPEAAEARTADAIHETSDDSLERNHAKPGPDASFAAPQGDHDEPHSPVPSCQQAEASGVAAAPSEPLDSEPDTTKSTTKDKQPKQQVILAHIPLGCIEDHPSVLRALQGLAIKRVPRPPEGLLTPRGIEALLVVMPLQLVRLEESYKCFAGLRLLEAARATLDNNSKVPALVHQSVNPGQILDSLRIELQILPLFHRLTPGERKEAILRLERAQQSETPDPMLRKQTKQAIAALFGCSVSSLRKKAC